MEDKVEAADPFMIIVPPIEQFTNSYLVTTPGENPIVFTNYINIIVEKAEVQGLRVDDQPVSFDVVGMRVILTANIITFNILFVNILTVFIFVVLNIVVFLRCDL